MEAASSNKPLPSELGDDVCFHHFRRNVFRSCSIAIKSYRGSFQMAETLIRVLHDR